MRASCPVIAAKSMYELAGVLLYELAGRYYVYIIVLF